MLEVAAELVARHEVFDPRQASVLLRRQGERTHELELAGSDGPAELERVARREVAVAIVNPSVLLTLACRGVSPFRGPLPLRAISVIPSQDQFVLAVKADAGIRRAEDLAGLDKPLRISVRGQRAHSIHVVIDHVLQASGTSLADLRQSGSTICYDNGMPNWGRLDAVRAGERDAIFDEGATTWTNEAVEAGMVILTMQQETVARLQTWGYRRAVLDKATYTALDADVLTVDFSGWPIYAHEEADAGLVEMFCEALEARRLAIPLQDGSPLPLEEMCADTAAAPLDVPLHDAARAFWVKRGYIRD
jgi:TRAP-type uncharacterized transport system substrate-binding protein